MHPQACAGTDPSVVTVYRINLSRLGTPSQAHWSYLSDDERARAARFHFAPDRVRFVASRIALRHILAKTLARPPSMIALTIADHGKPEISRDDNPCDWRFNLSHSGDVVLIAVTRGRSIGIDVEVVRPLPRQMAELLPRLSPREQHALQLVAEPERGVAFLRCWTRKEALVKAIGAGLTVDFASFSVSLGTDADPPIWDNAPGLFPWSLRALDDLGTQPEPFVAAVAVGGEIGSVVLANFHMD